MIFSPNTLAARITSRLSLRLTPAVVPKYFLLLLTLSLAWPQSARGDGVSLNGVTPRLAAKARQILKACPGSKIISAIAKRRNKSFHPIGRAVYIKGNPKCIYAQLANWKGGVSTDYWSVRCPPKWQRCPHVHIDTGPRLRFTHRRQPTATTLAMGE